MLNPEYRHDAVSDAVTVLNDALKLDTDAITRLVNTRIPIDIDSPLIDHPSIQVGMGEVDGKLVYYIRPLGLINGLFGSNDDQYGYIYANIADGWITDFGTAQDMSNRYVERGADSYQDSVDRHGIEWVDNLIDEDIEQYGNRIFHEAIRAELHRREQSKGQP